MTDDNFGEIADVGGDMPDDADAPWKEHRQALYDRVVHRGRLLQWRRRAIVAGILAVGFVVPMAAITASATSHPVEVLGFTIGGHREPATSTTTTAVTPTTTPKRIVGPPRTVASSVPVTSTTIAGCHDSFDPKCGAFSWATPPPTDALLVFDSSTPGAPAPGDLVTLAVRTEANVGALTVDWGDGSNDTFGIAPTCPGAATGPWTPPVLTSPSVGYTPARTFGAPGAYTVHLALSGRCGALANLPGAATADVLIVVGDAGATTTTTTTIATPPST